MPTLHVCSLARLPETVAATGAGHVLSLLTSGNALEVIVAPAGTGKSVTVGEKAATATPICSLWDCTRRSAWAT